MVETGNGLMIQIVNGKPSVTSLQVAHTFEKEHKTYYETLNRFYPKYLKTSESSILSCPNTSLRTILVLKSESLCIFSAKMALPC